MVCAGRGVCGGKHVPGALTASASATLRASWVSAMSSHLSLSALGPPRRLSPSFQVHPGVDNLGKEVTMGRRLATDVSRWAEELG